MGHLVRNFSLVALACLFLTACEKSSDDNGPKLGKAEDILWLSPDVQPETFRNIDKLFETRTIKRGEQVYPLPYSDSMLTSMTYTPDAVHAFKIGDFMARNKVAGLLIIKDGKIVLERYGLGSNEHSKWVGFSTTKSVVSTLIGIAIQDGKITSVNDQVVDYLPQLTGTAYDGVRIIDLLQMSSGVAWNEDYLDPNSDILAIFGCILNKESGGILNYMAGLERVAAPGTQYVYKTGETHVEAEVLKSVLQGETISDYFSRKIWANMGMEADANWLLESKNGTEFGGGLISMTLRDYGRFGLFMLNNGRVNGTALLPPDWVANVTTPPADAPQCACGALYSPANAGEEAYAYPLGYSYNWWPFPSDTMGSWSHLNDPTWWGSDAIWVSDPYFTNLLGTYTAQGIFGQFIHINPKENMVTIVLSAWETPWIDPKEFETYSFIDAAVYALKR